MKPLFSALVAALGLLAVSAYAADNAKPSQQSKMKTCNADAKAKSLKGDERKAFMSSCLKSK